MKNIKYINRKTNKIDIEKVYSEGLLKWCYNSFFGSLLRELVLIKKIISVTYGLTQDLRYSSKKIPDFINKMDLDSSEFIKDVSDFKTFNEFFIRKLKPECRPFSKNKNVLINPGDGKLLVYDKIDKDIIFQVKGSDISLEDLFQNKKISNIFENGTVYILRLCPSDYHRFHFPVSGEIVYYKKIKGEYYSVSPYALVKNINVFCRNRREISLFKTEHGFVSMIEVGAFGVGKIVQTFKNKVFKKGDEKGYFKFGGSTIITVFQNNKIISDKDIIENTMKGYETSSKFGERIGIFK